MLRLLLIALLTALSIGSARAETVRMGLFVGTNVGLGGDEPLRYAEREAEDLAAILQEMGGLTKDRTWILAGSDARVTRLRDTVTLIEGHIREADARGDSVLLIFYYTGHASHDGLHLNGEIVPMDWLRRWLETSAAHTRIAFVDACESGTLARARGGTPVDAIDITVDDALTASGLAIVTSSGPLSVARESEQFGGGVFSRALFTGLRGSADANGDGAVSLEEAYVHAFSETVIGTASQGSGIQRPEFRKELAGVGEVVLTRIAQRAAGMVLPEELEGIYAIVSVGTGQVVARVDKKPGEVRRVSLGPGRYLVRKVRTSDVLVAELDLVWGGDRWVDDAQMTVVPLGDPLARGASAPLGAVTLSPRFSTTTSMAARNPVTFGGEIETKVRVSPNWGLAMGIGLNTGARWDWTARISSTIGQLRVGMLHERRLARVDLQWGGGLQAVWLRQGIWTAEWDINRPDLSWFALHQFTAGPYGQLSVHMPVGPVFGLEAGVRAVVYPIRVDDQGSYFVMGQPFVGLGMRLGGRRLGTVKRRQ